VKENQRPARHEFAKRLLTQFSFTSGGINAQKLSLTQADP
jgi:hypothetical protein